MALIKCKACEKEISPNAVSCPHCGEPLAAKVKKKGGIGCGTVLLWFFALFAVFSLFVYNKGREVEDLQRGYEEFDSQVRSQMSADHKRWQKGADELDAAVREQMGEKSPKQRGQAKEFKQFADALKKLNAKTKQAAGIEFFTNAADLGDGMVQVTATETWLNTSRGAREKNLKTIYDLWDVAEGSGLPIAVYIVDKNGKIRMQKSRGLN